MFRLVSPLALLLFSTAGTIAVSPSAQGQDAHAVAFDDPALEWGPCPDFLPEGCAIAVLNGDPAGDDADVFFSVPGGSRIASHWHTSAERMVLVSGQLDVTYEGQDTVTLRPGMYAYGPAKLAHEAECAAGDPCILFIAFESPVDAVPTGD
jgi:mannose-6-phosphate isomerase-like protein (cupin superfamily)